MLLICFIGINNFSYLHWNCYCKQLKTQLQTFDVNSSNLEMKRCNIQETSRARKDKKFVNYMNNSEFIVYKFTKLKLWVG